MDVWRKLRNGCIGEWMYRGIKEWMYGGIKEWMYWGMDV